MRAKGPMSRALCVQLLALIIAFSSGGLAWAQTETFKVATYNIRSGKGIDELSGHPSTFDSTTSNCTDPSQPLNAWGVRVVQDKALATIRNDTSIIALGLNEAWGCGSPTNVKNELGWAAASSERNGTGLVARHGFKPGTTEAWQQLDTQNCSNPKDTQWVLHREMCATQDCSKTIDVFVTHWYCEGTAEATTIATQAQQTIDFMALRAGSRPRVLIGDLNVFEQTNSCQTTAAPWGLDLLRNAGYTDAWPTVNPGNPGYTGMVNRSTCPGGTYKRIDYSWSQGIFTPLAAQLFGVVTPYGAEAPSDHYGVIAQYSIGAPSSDTTPPTASIQSPLAGAGVSGNQTITVQASDNVGVARVDIFVDGALLRSITTPPYETNWDTTLYANGDHVLTASAFDATGNRGDSASVNVTVSNSSPPPPGTFWTAVVKATPDDASLRKTDGCEGCDDAGGVSEAQLTGAGDFVEFTPTWGHRLTAGLNTDTTDNTSYSTIAFAFNFWPSGAWDIREHNVYRSEGTYAAGDVFKIAVEGTSIKYYRNGSLLYTSTVVPSFPLVLDTSLFTLSASASISNARVVTGPTAVDWTNRVNTNPEGNTLEKTSGCATCFDAGAISVQQITGTVDVALTFEPSTAARFFVGFGNDTSTNTERAPIKFAFSFWENGGWDVRESDTYRTEGTFVAGDLFKIAIEGGVVKYYKNQTLVYTSQMIPTFPLIVDTSLKTIGARVLSPTIK
jgi:exonuclease III